MEKIEKYSWQECQDEAIKNEFNELHRKLVNEVVDFCKRNNIKADTFSIGADGLRSSIEYGKWCPATDSSFSIGYDITRRLMEEKNLEDPFSITDEEYREAKIKYKPILYSI